MSPPKTPGGYLKIALIDGKRKKETNVHRFVLEAFVGPCPEGMEGCHNNGNRTDNRLENLRWDTKLANQADRRKHGTTPLGEKNCKAKLNEEQVREIKAHLKDGLTLKKLAVMYSVSFGLISQIKTGRVWSHI